MTQQIDMHDLLDAIERQGTEFMDNIENRALYGDDIAYVAIHAAGGHFFGDSNISDFEDPPEDIYPFARPAGTHM